MDARRRVSLSRNGIHRIPRVGRVRPTGHRAVDHAKSERYVSASITRSPSRFLPRLLLSLLSSLLGKFCRAHHKSSHCLVTRLQIPGRNHWHTTCTNRFRQIKPVDITIEEYAPWKARSEEHTSEL